MRDPRISEWKLITNAPTTAAPFVTVDKLLTRTTGYLSGWESSQRMNGVASLYVMLQKMTRRRTNV